MASTPVERNDRKHMPFLSAGNSWVPQMRWERTLLPPTWQEKMFGKHSALVRRNRVRIRSFACADHRGVKRCGSVMAITYISVPHHLTVPLSDKFSENSHQ